MSYRVNVRPRAKRQILDAARYLESKREHSGIAFYDQIDEVMSLLADHPEVYPVVEGPYRRAPIKKYPYSLYYSIEKRKVIVEAVWHQSRNVNKIIF